MVGSRAYAKEAKEKNEEILGMINLDGIGYDGNNDRKHGIHSGTGQDSQILGEFFFNKTKEFGLNLQPLLFTQGSSGASDHSSFWNYKYPAIFLPRFSRFFAVLPFNNDRLRNLNLPYFHDISKLTIAGLVSLAEMVPSGIYFLRLEYDRKIQTKKII